MRGGGERREAVIYLALLCARRGEYIYFLQPLMCVMWLFGVMDVCMSQIPSNYIKLSIHLISPPPSPIPRPSLFFFRPPPYGAASLNSSANQSTSLPSALTCIPILSHTLCFTSSPSISRPGKPPCTALKVWRLRMRHMLARTGGGRGIICGGVGLAIVCDGWGGGK